MLSSCNCSQFAGALCSGDNIHHAYDGREKGSSWRSRAGQAIEGGKAAAAAQDAAGGRGATKAEAAKGEHATSKSPPSPRVHSYVELFLWSARVMGFEGRMASGQQCQAGFVAPPIPVPELEPDV